MAKGTRGGRRANKTHNIQIGDETIELDDELVYGDKSFLTEHDKTNVQPFSRLMIESWERDRSKYKSEFVQLYRELPGDLQKIGDTIRGTKTSVGVSKYLVERATILTHTHPRGKNELGGTFSTADINSFTNADNMRTYRAVAKEGTYSITKGKNYNKQFAQAYAQQVRTLHRLTEIDAKSAYSKYKNKETTYEQYASSIHKINNNRLNNMHKFMLANQSNFGYTYSLEKR